MSSVLPSGRVTRTPRMRPSASAYRSVARAEVASGMSSLSTAAIKAASSSAPKREGDACMCLRLWPGYWKSRMHDRGSLWRSYSQSTVFADSRAISQAISWSHSPCALLMMSLARISGVSSSSPASRCSLVPAAGIWPPESEVLPVGLGSRSRISTSAPCSFAASAAIVPQAPAPTIKTCVRVENVLPSAFNTGIPQSPLLTAHEVGQPQDYLGKGDIQSEREEIQGNEGHHPGEDLAERHRDRRGALHHEDVQPHRRREHPDLGELDGNHAEPDR